MENYKQAHELYWCYIIIDCAFKTQVMWTDNIENGVGNDKKKDCSNGSEEIIRRELIMQMQ
jgi:hypothetical protein